MSVYSDRSSRTTSTNTSTSSAMSSSATPHRTSTPPVITALPSFAHSLSAFPSMTSVTSDMMHYGTLGRTKSVSEARLNTALQATKQRRDAYPHTVPGSPTSPLDDADEDDDQALVITRRKSKGPKGAF